MLISEIVEAAASREDEPVDSKKRKLSTVEAEDAELADDRPSPKPDKLVAIKEHIAAHLSQSNIAMFLCFQVLPPFNRSVAHVSQSDLAMLSCASKYCRDLVEQYMHRKDDDNNTRGEDEVEEDEDDDLRSGFSTMTSITSKYRGTLAIKDTPGLARSFTRATDWYANPASLELSVVQSRSEYGSDDGSDDLEAGDGTLDFSLAKDKQLIAAPWTLTAASKRHVPVKQQSKQQPPRPTIFSIGSLPTSASCRNPIYPSLELSTPWRRIQGAIHYPSFSFSG
ncbi:uncharacterized protein BDZ99DRAFT_527082 [Mytilinidion resinicola]|uniref:Uncharacterized protein n=1 Tax=Mytilinidion resinicola TaxID=574789 RepID=A0A6A6Y2H9_9PEZI|nr:uncharacterized protein BDZ99DRAFT_527082 [Mytilinidion resinicola]KAF2802992.1 hypothetical protein BDZ99DRAFT_527082 [Mytilinidion resinicola]